MKFRIIPKKNIIVIKSKTLSKTRLIITVPEETLSCLLNKNDLAISPALRGSILFRAKLEKNGPKQFLNFRFEFSHSKIIFHLSILKQNPIIKKINPIKI